jgi:hypothetical protein
VLGEEQDAIVHGLPHTDRSGGQAGPQEDLILNRVDDKGLDIRVARTREFEEPSPHVQLVVEEWCRVHVARALVGIDRGE